MRTSCYALVEGGRLAAVSLEDALSGWRSGAGAFWVDASEYDEASLRELLDQAGVSAFLKQRCLEAGQATTVLAVPKGTFAEWALFADKAWTRRTYAGALCLPGLLFTFHEEPIEGSEEMHETISLLELERITTSNLLCALLVDDAVETARAARVLRDRVFALSERMDRDPTDVTSEELEELKRKVLLTHAIADEQHEAFSLITQARSAGFDTSEISGSLGLLTTTAGATDRLIDRCDGRVENLLRRAQDYKAERLNSRLGLLTIISAIFLPLTLLAGIWGMNFEQMPELNDPYAYPAALTLMAVIGLGGAWAFYKRGWFD